MRDLRKEFVDSNKGDVDVKIFINKEGYYVMCPYGRSPIKKWIGMAKLNYFLTGDYRHDREETIVENIIDCINVGINYDKMGIEKNNDDDIATAFLKEAKKDNYDKFHVISIDLSDLSDEIQVVGWERVGNRGNEWRGKPDSAINISYEEFETTVMKAINSFI